MNDTIGNSQFASCTALKDVTFSNSLRTISGAAFNKASSLESITIPASVTSIGSYAFEYCTALTDVTVAIDNASFSACFINNALRIESPNAELINIYSITGSLLYSGKKNEGVIEIPFIPIQGVYIIKGSVSGTIKVIK